jgi:hypothetical protein
MIRNIDCVIERRLLVNYRIDPDQVAALLPGPFRPQVVRDHAVGGVCFIHPSGIRPAPALLMTDIAARWTADRRRAHGEHAAA